MVTSRTGTASHFRFRRAVLSRDRRAGVVRCPLCGVALDYDVSKQPHSAEPDHILPVAMGGTNHPDNGRTICRRCNQSRGGRSNAKMPTPRPTTNLVDW